MNLSLKELMKWAACLKLTDKEVKTQFAKNHPELEPCEHCDYIKKHCRCDN